MMTLDDMRAWPVYVRVSTWCHWLPTDAGAGHPTGKRLPISLVTDCTAVSLDVVTISLDFSDAG